MKTRKRDDLENMVVETIFSQTITKEQFIGALSSCKDQKIGDDTDAIAAKVFLSGTLYGYFWIGKQTARDVIIKQIKNELNAGEIDAKGALLKFLRSSVGQTDSHSLKYLVLQQLFGLHARNDSEAKAIVTCSIKALEQSDNACQLTTRLSIRDNQKI